MSGLKESHRDRPQSDPLKSEAGFTGSYDSVKRFIRLRCQANELPFRRMECAP